ncbi:sugar phosphate nucleotidyltransferase [Robertkochia flava]|uniref:sugar phosphate nucleotidyltransferase n=1 Tax=Robertkochia flava TaxID=3447986 RepID=UPI001CCA443A|nr:sugar phosphate nucleotidyltransferase [Robertkochia marina]
MNKTETETLVILAGGASSRMKAALSAAESDLTPEEMAQANQRSKGLIQLGKNQYPLLDYVLFNAKRAGYKNIVFLTGEDAAPFRSQYLKPDKRYQGLNVFFAVQSVPEGRKKPLGTADALLQAIEQQAWLKDTRFVVCNSDNLYSIKSFSMLRNTQAPNAFISYDRDGLKFSRERINRFALVKTDTEGYLEDIIEKPSVQESEQYRDDAGKFRVSMNIFMFTGSQVLPFLQNCPLHPVREEKEIPTALLNMVKAHPRSVLGIPLTEHVPDLTSKSDIRILKQYLETHYPQELWQ